MLIYINGEEWVLQPVIMWDAETHSKQRSWQGTWCWYVKQSGVISSVSCRKSNRTHRWALKNKWIQITQHPPSQVFPFNFIFSGHVEPQDLSKSNMMRSAVACITFVYEREWYSFQVQVRLGHVVFELHLLNLNCSIHLYASSSAFRKDGFPSICGLVDPALAMPFLLWANVKPCFFLGNSIGHQQWPYSDDPSWLLAWFLWPTECD